MFPRRIQRRHMEREIDPDVESSNDPRNNLSSKQGVVISFFLRGMVLKDTEVGDAVLL